jgi:hypothetical protein
MALAMLFFYPLSFLTKGLIEGCRRKKLCHKKGAGHIRRKAIPYGETSSAAEVIGLTPLRVSLLRGINTQILSQSDRRNDAKSQRNNDR